MNRTLRIIQLNVRKQGAVHESLMNDEDTQNAVALAIQEPQARRIQGRLLTTPMGHHKWTKMGCGSGASPDRVARSNSGRDSASRTTGLYSISLRGRRGGFCVERRVRSPEKGSCKKVRRDTGAVVEVMIVGDFNRHDQLWGGDEVSLGRQGEADPIIDLMNEFALSSLLERGTKTWHGVGQSGDCESTIDLVLASDNLTDSMIKCAIHGTEYGSDHRAIEAVFNAPWPIPKYQERLLLKNAPWNEINARIASTLAATPSEGTVQQKTDRLMSAVSDAVHNLTPRAKPSPHAKRWWTTDLTQPRHIYTYWRNHARSERRAGRKVPRLEKMAQDAAKQYHDAISKQKKKHWNEFLADNDNIWKAARYLNSGEDAAFGKLPQLVRADGTTTADHMEQAEELLSKFFPPLPDNIDDEGTRPQREPVEMPAITLEEVERQLLATKSWKAPGEDGLPAIRVGAQAIVGTFLTVATSVAEAEAHIATARQRFWRRAVKMWTDMHTLPETNPLRRGTDRIRKFRRYHRSPLYRVADALKHIDMETLETINPSILAPWEERIQPDMDQPQEIQTRAGLYMQIAVSSSARNELVGFGVAIEKQPPRYRKLKLKTLSVTLGARAEQNPFSAELAAMAHALKMVVGIKDYKITLLTSNKAAALTLRNPRRQSGQKLVYQIYKLIRRLRRNRNRIKIHWIRTSEDNNLSSLAKNKPELQHKKTLSHRNASRG
ncbi:Endonuclease/exonuclease/phosphatase [Penicillium italicum]|uniref:Endonuclease/exonuclease/phosphatase n=1 Tax=Penicillium italicum TaxID=40296 RepID=A0A0A2L4W5_PENIT|nr:Endonuclease/exonuclease/phosphatase [Penicillium italicum]